MRFLLFMLTLMSFNAIADNTDAKQMYIEQTQPIIMGFAKALKSELQAAVKAGGPVAGISVCNTNAPEITKQSSKEGWQVRRTSHKWRNPDNKPDQWEIQQLEIFKQKMEAGADPKTLWATYEDTKSIRVMKAIPTQPLCLGCHGDTLAPNVQKTISELYPNDRATGFKAGELRGAFSLQQYKF